MKCTIFYSWQSDLPNNTNRGLIQRALDTASKNIRNDESILVEPRIDKDTQNVSGSPNIPETILRKIDNSEVFVCDVSIINNGSKFRPTPNPNVLFELGYALKKFGWDRIIMVCNEAFGSIGKLPFDLEKRRVIGYFVSETDEDKSPGRKKLEGILEAQIRSIIEELNRQNASIIEAPEELSIKEQAIDQIKNGNPLALTTVTEYFENAVLKMEEFGLTDSDEITTDLIIEKIGDTLPFRDDLIDVIATISRYSTNPEFYIAIHNFFESLIDYLVPSRKMGSFNTWQADHYKFFINELFLYAAAALINYRRFQELNELTAQGYFVSNQTSTFKAGNHRFKLFNTHSEALRFYNDRLSKKFYSIYGHFFEKRATRKDMDFEALMQADIFLYILDQIQEVQDRSPWNTWFPDTLPYTVWREHSFKVFARAESASFFEKMTIALSNTSKGNFERLVKELDVHLKDSRWGFHSTEISRLVGLDKIATRP